MSGEELRPRQVVKGQHIDQEKADFARTLRGRQTEPEARLWARLRGGQIAGLKFRRQQVVGGFIADFYCHAAALAVEVDGPTHDPSADTWRDEAFRLRGIRIVRVTNQEVMQQMEDVLNTIQTAATLPPILADESHMVGGENHVEAKGRNLTPPAPLSRTFVPHGERGENVKGVVAVTGTNVASDLPPLPVRNERPGEGGRGGEVTPDVVNARTWDADHVMTTYARQPVQFVRGEGVRLYDAEGCEYLDFLAGIAVNSVGHNHPRLTRAISEQAATLLHVSNLFLTAPQARLARRLIELSDFERVFFCNSGAEANEAAIKLSRKYGRGIRESKTGIVTAHNSFHGRTLATVTATGQPKYSAPFAPLPGGFSHVPFNDADALRASVSDDTCAILLEPIQGEGGVLPATVEYLRAARELADQTGALLIFDEVQTGVGRTGKLWAYQRYGVVPDVMTLAKGLGGGVPIGSCLARGAAAETLKPGDHGSTFAGNPLSTAAANAVLDILADEGLTENALRVGAHLTQAVSEMRERLPQTVGGVRGMGLMLGIQLLKPIARKVVGAALRTGLVINATSDETLRLLPPLILTEADARRGMTLLEQAIRSVDSE